MSASKPTEWRPAAEFPAPGQSEIHVWRINLNPPAAEVARHQTALSTAERERAARFRFPQDQRRFAVRRAFLRRLLAACLGVSPQAVQLESGPHGKPFVAGQAEAGGLRFSCSHSADLALVALARGIELGVDVEQHRDLNDAGDLAGAFFSTREIRELAALPPALKLAGFFNCWTRKEAFVKATGLGLSSPLNRFSVSLTPDKPAAITDVADDPDAIEKWSILSLNAGPNCSAALVFEAKTATRMKLFEESPQPAG
jgi:4'-phosphopantetheinyl transferase